MNDLTNEIIEFSARSGCEPGTMSLASRESWEGDMSSPMGLYYPFIHFKDEEWLKVAALYWPRMCRIVPPGYSPADSDTVRALSEELDFVHNVSPVSGSARVAPLFLEFLQNHEQRLSDRYGVDKALEWAPDPVTVQRMQLDRDDASMASRLAHIYTSKLNPVLLDGLIQSGLAVHARSTEWIGVHPRLANVYMMALAEEVATENQLEPITDETMDHLAVSGWTMSRLAQALLGEEALGDPGWGGGEVSAAFAFVAIRSVIPAQSLDVGKVIQIRKRYEQERGQFAIHLREIGASLDSLGVTDPEAFAAHLGAEYDAKIATEIADLKRAMKDVGVETAFGAINLRLTIPPVLAGAAEIGGFTLAPMVGLGSAIAVGLAGLTRSFLRQREQLVAHSPIGYLLRVQKELTPSSLRGWIRESMSRFVRSG
jgi:hypothetical protein